VHIDEAVQTWHVEVNNPTDTAVTVLLNQSTLLPGLTFGSQRVTIAAGAVEVLL
jgi:hypothetical protein